MIDRPGIYCITNHANGKVYVGSGVSVGARLRTHRCLLSQGKSHNVHLQRAWDRHGKQHFTFAPLFFCEKHDLIFFEQRAIDTLHATDRRFGYNKRLLAENNFGRKISPEHVEKMRLRQIGRRASLETRTRMSAAQLGRLHAEETKKKISLARKGMRFSEEHRLRLSISHRGRIPWNKGVPMRPESKEKLSASQKCRLLKGKSL